MRKKRHTPEEIISKLRQVDVLVGQGTPVADAIRSIEVTEVAQGRAARWGDLLQLTGGSDHHRELETALQYGPASWLAGLQATRSGGVCASLCRMAGCAHPTGSAGHAQPSAKADPQLTFTPDHPMGADQGHIRHNSHTRSSELNS